MRVSLITPVLDEAGTLEELIAAVRAQTRRPDEWIVVDGGSADRSVEILAAAGGCRVLEVRGNIARGRNAGVAAASGEIIATLDAGCRPRRGWLETLVAPIEEGSAAVAAGSTWPRISTPFEAAQATLLDQFVMPGFVLRQPAFSARCLAFRVEVWQRSSFPEWLDHGEDKWTLDDWSRGGHEVVRVPEAIVEWRLRPSIRAVLEQHFRYMRGDGRATMNTLRHALRFGFYGLILVLCLVGPSPVARWSALGAWSFYALLSALRLSALGVPSGRGFRLQTMLWILGLLPAIDLAKMMGYLTGLLDRVGKARDGR